MYKHFGPTKLRVSVEMHPVCGGIVLKLMIQRREALSSKGTGFTKQKTQIKRAMKQSFMFITLRQ